MDQDLMAEQIVARLVLEEWELSREILMGGTGQSEDSRLRYIAARQDAIIARAAVLRALAGRVLEQSSPEAMQAAADRAAAVKQAQLDASRNAAHVLQMAIDAAIQNAPDKLQAASDYVDECQAAFDRAQRSFVQNPGLRDSVASMELDRKRQELADAQAAYKSLLASKGRMSPGMTPAASAAAGAR